MNPFIAKILPIIAFFFLGIFFKYLKIFSLNDGHFLLKLVFYLFLPALAFISMIETDISSSFMIIPFLPI
ncbi:MAG: AEC family transporter, partial [Candidatus Cloacimonetes bacterium]|nr:AEC family transporter [Candidatus Cloacimonadota bacterium]